MCFLWFYSDCLQALLKKEISRTVVRVSCTGWEKFLIRLNSHFPLWVCMHANVIAELHCNSFPFSSCFFADPVCEKCSDTEIQSFQLFSSLVKHKAGVYCGFDETKCLQTFTFHIQKNNYAPQNRLNHCFSADECVLTLDRTQVFHWRLEFACAFASNCMWLMPVFIYLSLFTRVSQLHLWHMLVFWSPLAVCVCVRACLSV